MVIGLGLTGLLGLSVVARGARPVLQPASARADAQLQASNDAEPDSGGLVERGLLSLMRAVANGETAGGDSTEGAGGFGVVVTPTGVVVPVLAPFDPDLGWLVATPCDGRAYLGTGVTVADADVVLDPGHGGVETGAVGPGGLAEKDVNLAVAWRVADLLRREGVRTYLTRTADYRITLATRAEIALALEPELFVSIHHNGGSDSRAGRPGTMVFHQMASTEAHRLAGLVYEEAVAELSRLPVEWVGGTEAGVRFWEHEGQDFYGVLRRSVGVPAILTELSYITNPAEEAVLASGELIEIEAVAIARAIQRHLRSDDMGSGDVTPLRGPGRVGGTGGASGCEEIDLT